MSDPNTLEMRSNIIEFPTAHLNWIEKPEPKPLIPTPIVDEMELAAQKLDILSNYKSQFDWEPLRGLERRTTGKPIRGGFIFKIPMRLVNSHTTCQQCLYSFEIDTYGRGCIHNCTYCYAKAELTQHGIWNNPYPVPVDINAVRNIFYTVFETTKKSKWRSILEKRIPIRIGSMSDSFMWMDEKFKVTKELIRILNHYNYPYLIFTRSDLVAKEDYMSLLRRDLCAVQFSMSSTNENLNRLIEPGAPSAKRRLKALEGLNREGFWTTVRINPIFPIYPDGYFTNPDFKWDGPVPKFEFTTFEMIDEIADTKTPAVLAGFGRFSGYALNQIEKASGVNLRPFFNAENKKSARDHHYSGKEVRFYYEQFKKRSTEKGISFTTCYIGNGEAHFWKDQDIWSNKKDCCNVKGNVASFKSDSREVPFEERIKHNPRHIVAPNDVNRLHTELGLTKKVFELHQDGALQP